MDKKHTSRLEDALKDSANKRVLSCVFLSDVFCSFRKSESLGVMERCFVCDHWKRFERDMDEEDEKVMDEVQKIRKYGYPKRFS